MSKQLVERVVHAYGGLTAMARSLGHSYPSTVQGWRDRGHIPNWRIYEIRNSGLFSTLPTLRKLIDALEVEQNARRHAFKRDGKGEDSRLVLQTDAAVDATHDPVGCRYITGDPKGEWRYCNRPQCQGSAYCMAHHALCCRPADDPELNMEIADIAAAAVREDWDGKDQVPEPSSC